VGKGRDGHSLDGDTSPETAGPQGED
jgi:hypothetical protein